MTETYTELVDLYCATVSDLCESQVRVSNLEGELDAARRDVEDLRDNLGRDFLRKADDRSALRQRVVELEAATIHNHGCGKCAKDAGLSYMTDTQALCAAHANELRAKVGELEGERAMTEQNFEGYVADSRAERDSLRAALRECRSNRGDRARVREIVDAALGTPETPTPSETATEGE